MNVTINTMTVEPINSSLVVQVTFFNSALASFKKPIILLATRRPLTKVSLAGLEGFEPPTSGFGDRRSTSWSYRPIVQTMINV